MACAYTYIHILTLNIDDFIYELLPNTDYVAANTFWVGLYHGLDKSDLDKILMAFDTFKENRLLN